MTAHCEERSESSFKVSRPSRSDDGAVDHPRKTAPPVNWSPRRPPKAVDAG